MAFTRVISNVSPAIKVEVIHHSLVGNVIARFYVADVNGIFPVAPTGFLDVAASQGNWNYHLCEFLKESGVAVADETEAAAWLKTKTKSEAKAVIKNKNAWNRFIERLVALFNKYWKANITQPVPGPITISYATSEEFFSDLLNQTVFQVEPSGLISGKLLD